MTRTADEFGIRQGKSSYIIRHQDVAAVIDSLVICKFTNMAVAEEYFSRALSAVTGLDFSTGDLIRVGERVCNLERLYNLREGFTAADDTLPPRLLQEAVAEGPSQGWVSNLPTMLREYYRSRGWDTQGVPTREKLEELELENL